MFKCFFCPRLLYRRDLLILECSRGAKQSYSSGHHYHHQFSSFIYISTEPSCHSWNFKWRTLVGQGEISRYCLRATGCISNCETLPWHVTHDASAAVTIVSAVTNCRNAKMCRWWCKYCNLGPLPTPVWPLSYTCMLVNLLKEQFICIPHPLARVARPVLASKVANLLVYWFKFEQQSTRKVVFILSLIFHSCVTDCDSNCNEWLLA